jgi:hypothetical protein
VYRPFRCPSSNNNDYITINDGFVFSCPIMDVKAIPYPTFGYQSVKYFPRKKEMLDAIYTN